jgi:DNA polymerase III subunit gamma/tau
MSSLYVRYRPTTFEEMVGNESAIASLQKSITKKNHSHVYLFSGPAGTGKTTTARILSKMFNAGEMDIREFNIANMRGIDDARKIIEQIRFNPSDGEAIVYILDECHKFTTDAQNALLKPLEDTPDSVYFFLCSSEPNKLIKAIKSRCTPINFKLLNTDELLLVLNRVVKKEKAAIDKEVLESICDNADGSPRNALVLLEKVIDIEDKKEAINIIKNGIVNEEDAEIIELARALLAKKPWNEVNKILSKLKENNKLDDAETVRYIILGYMSAVLLKSANKQAAIVMDAFKENTFNTGKFGIILASFDAIN